MIKSCEFCSIPKRQLGWEDFYEKMILWRRYVKEGLFKFKGGDAMLENFEEEIAREQKYVYYFYFECNCGNYLKSGVCIRSSVPVIEQVDYLKNLISHDRPITSNKIKVYIHFQIESYRFKNFGVRERSTSIIIVEKNCNPEF